MAVKKFLSLDRLEEYDALIKQTITNTVSGKADANHNHDSAYDAKGSASTALDSAKEYAKDYTDDAIANFASTITTESITDAEIDEICAVAAAGVYDGSITIS